MAIRDDIYQRNELPGIHVMCEKVAKMKTCKQCQLQMEEGYVIKVDTYGIPKIERGIGKPDSIKVAVCPKCGDISLYIEKLTKQQRDYINVLNEQIAFAQLIIKFYYLNNKDNVCKGEIYEYIEEKSIQALHSFDFNRRIHLHN